MLTVIQPVFADVCYFLLLPWPADRPLPAGNVLATSGADGTVRTYTLDLAELVTLARARLTRTLTVEECRKFLHTPTCPES